MCEVGTHSRCLLGPCRELDGGEGLAGPVGVSCLVYKVDRCAHCAVLTCEGPQACPTAGASQPPATSYHEEQGLEVSLPEAASQLLCPRWDPGKVRGTAFIFILSGFVLPLSQLAVRRKKRRRKKPCAGKDKMHSLPGAKCF